MRTRVLFALTGALVLPRVPMAQTPTLEVGSRVRVRTEFDAWAGSPSKVYRVLGIHADSLLLVQTERTDSVTTVPLRDITHLEISRGRRTHKSHDALIGFLIGAPVGALFGYLDGDDPPSTVGFLSAETTYLHMTAAEKAVAGGVGLGLVGALIGAIVGSPVTDDWVGVPLDRLSVSVAPGRWGGIRLSMTANF